MDNSPCRGLGAPTDASIFLRLFGCSLLVLALGPYGNVSPVGTLDPWIYTGYFQNFTDLIEKFGLAYYCSRLPYILVGIAAYNVFAPAVANWVLNALWLTTMLAPLYLIIRRYYDGRAATLATLAGLTNAFLISTIVWDYPDGPAISYVFLGLWLMLAPPAMLGQTAALLLGGACLTMAGLTNFISGVIIVSMTMAAAVWRGRSFTRTLLDLVIVAAGALACLGAWCAISHFTLGTWNILGPQWTQVRYATDHSEYLPNMWGRGNDWIRSAFRHLPPLLLIVALGLSCVIPAWRQAGSVRIRIAAMLGLTVAFGIFAWIEFIEHKILLRVFYHSSYLLVPSLIALSVIVATAFIRLPAHAWSARILALICGILLVGPPVLRGYLGWLKQPMLPLMAAACVAVLGAFPFAGKKAGPWVVAALLCLVSSWSVVTDPSVAAFAFRPKEALFFPDRTDTILSRKASYQHALAADLLVLLKNADTRGHPIYFWYDRDEPNVNLLDSLSSLYLWGYRDHTKQLPGLDRATLINWFPPGSRIVHVTEFPARVERDRALLNKAGVTWRELGTWRLGERGNRFRLSIDEVSVP